MDENGLSDKERAAFAAVDDALRTYPLAPAPPELARAVRNRIRASMAMPRFRPAWIDYAVSGFAAAMVGLIVLLLRSIPPHWVAYAQGQLSVLLLVSTPTLLWPVVLGVSLMVALAMLAAVIILARGPSPQIR